MQNKVDLSIVIVNYNTFELTHQCINSIVKESNNIAYEIIVVDNASTDKDVDALKTFFPEICTIKNTTNVGFGVANNKGMKIAKGSFILLLNSDTIIIEKGIEKALAFIKNNKDIDVLTCRQLNEEGKPFIPMSFYFKNNDIINYLTSNPILQLVKNKFFNKTTKNLATNSYVKSLSGAFMLLKQEVFTKTNGFDPDFFIYYEETEWCMRINTYFKQYYLHDVSFIHLHGKSAPRLIMQKQMHLSQGLFWYKAGYVKYICFLLIAYFIYVPSWLMLCVLSVKSSSRKHFFKYLKIYLQLFTAFILNIPSSKNSYASRKKTLKLKELD